MRQNVAKSCHIAPNIARYCRILPKFLKPCEILPNNVKRCVILPSLWKYRQVVSNCDMPCRIYEIAINLAKYRQILPNHASTLVECFRISPCLLKLRQVLSNVGEIGEFRRIAAYLAQSSPIVVKCGEVFAKIAKCRHILPNLAKHGRS